MSASSKIVFLLLIFALATYQQQLSPGARGGTVTWINSNGDLYLFGGAGYGHSSKSSGNKKINASLFKSLLGSLNDLWRYEPLLDRWTWLHGNSSAMVPGVYGVQGVPSASNTPSARAYASSWVGADGSLWMFGGIGFAYSNILGTSRVLHCN